jgi:hypothetical protein
MTSEAITRPFLISLFWISMVVGCFKSIPLLLTTMPPKPEGPIEIKSAVGRPQWAVELRFQALANGY